MKNYIKPMIEIIKISPEEEILSDQDIISGDWGYEDGEGWED